MDVRNTGGNKYETTAREIQNYQFSTFFGRSKMTSRKVTATALKVNVKKFQPTSTSSLACVLTNLDAFCPMEVHLPGEKSILPYFSSLRGVAISVPFPEVRNRKGTESGLLAPPPELRKAAERSECCFPMRMKSNSALKQILVSTSPELRKWKSCSETLKSFLDTL